jgi:hypothetical protein
MDPFRDTSIRAAWRADFSTHIPLTEDELRLLQEVPDRRSAARTLVQLSRLLGPIGRLRGGRDTPDALGLQPFTPPL